MRWRVGSRITGYLAICANLYERAGQGNPDDVAAKVRADGGISDAEMVGDSEAAVKWVRAQSNHNGKVGVFGSCSGGRHALHLCLPEERRRRMRRSLGRPRGDGRGRGLSLKLRSCAPLSTGRLPLPSSRRRK
jgi:hypothetical protein